MPPRATVLLSPSLREVGELNHRAYELSLALSTVVASPSLRPSAVRSLQMGHRRSDARREPVRGFTSPSLA